MKNYTPKIESGGLSVIGPVREDNQDAIRLSDDEHLVGHGWLYAIADGMGGYANGGMASLMALESIDKALMGHTRGSITRSLQRGVEAANLKIYQEAQKLSAGRMGTTLTAAYVLGSTLYLAHVGDSRAYLIRNGQAICLTQDHTIVGDMVRSKLIPASTIRTHAQRSILTKSVGLDLFVQPDITQHTLKEGDRLVLCSDGVWSVIEDEEFAQVVGASHSVEESSRKLIDLALHHNTDDNASVIVFHLHKLIPVLDKQRVRTSKNTSWFQTLRKFV